MKHVLQLGAGLSAAPMPRYLLAQPDFSVCIADKIVENAQKLAGGHQRATAVALDVEDQVALERLVAWSDITVSLLPFVYHVKVANLCLKHRKHLVTASYVSDAMRQLDGQAKSAGVIFLNEIGLDPGIDHMSAMKVIHDVQKAGGKVTSFMSYCGGLPAPEANDNPLGYKFSWSPKGVVMAGRNDARYLEDGKEVFVPGANLFGHRWPLKVANGFEFEAYPNRNSLSYIDTYGLTGARTMFRGTLRNFGWCETIKAIADLGVLKDDTVRTGIGNLTPAAWLRRYAPGPGTLRADVAARLGMRENDPAIERFAWLGLFDEKPIGLEQGSNLDILAKQMLDRMAYKPRERDMIVLHHEFVAEMPQASSPKPRTQSIYSTLIAFGEPGGDSAMARTVSLPAAIAVRMILHGELKLTGVQIPVLPEIYGSILAELTRLGIECKERKAPAS